jgi:hypothetical protein
MRSDPIASLVGLAKPHGVGESKDAGRRALRLPAFCGVPTREAARQVRDVSGAAQKASTAQCTSLTPQRRQVLPNPDALESLGTEQASLQVERIRRPKNRSNDRETVILSNSYQEVHGPARSRQEDYRLPESAVS